MDHFNYKNNELYAEDVALHKIAESVGTPFYCYSSATIERHYNVFMESFGNKKPLLCFAVKSNSNLAVIKTLANLGAGGDAVSEGEIRRCIAAGVSPQKIVFSGVGKTRDEIKYALSVGIMQFNIESEPELERINEVAISMGKKAPVAFRVNPDIDAGTHDKITTGRKEDKFGIEWDSALSIYKKASKMEGIAIRGIAVHIGSQLTNLAPFDKAFKKLKELLKELRASGLNIEHLDLGGGLGIPYNTETPPSPSEYAKMVIEATKDMDCSLTFEPGRLIVGNAGVLVTSVIYLKKTSAKNFLIVDAAMNDLIRPTLYNAYHEVVGLKKNSGAVITCDVVGPICETGDVLARSIKLPEMAENDLVAIRSAGAYGAVMSCEYNSRLLIPEVLVRGNKFAVIRKRPSYEEMLARDVIPDWN